MRVALDPKIEELQDVPYTISYVIRKRQQIDNLNELPKEKRPPDSIVWDGTPEEMDEWLDKVFDNKHKETMDLIIKPSDVEG